MSGISLNHTFRLLCLCLFSFFSSNFFANVALAQQIIPPSEFYEGVMSGTFDAVIDVRTQSEWDSGHVPNATHIESLHLQNMPPFPEILEEGSCNSESSTIVVYCRSGARAGAAIQKLLDAGYKGTLYNGQGTNQWKDAGYSLVKTDSVDPKCSQMESLSSSSISKSSDPPSSLPSNIISTSPSFSPSNTISTPPSFSTLVNNSITSSISPSMSKSDRPLKVTSSFPSSSLSTSMPSVSPTETPKSMFSIFFQGF